MAAEKDSVQRGYCQCGCGGKTRLAPVNDKRRGWVRGEPVSYVSCHSGRPIAERFWSKVDRRGADECWPWTGSRVRGYGQIGVRGQLMLAHRFSWSLANGPVPDGLYVIHTCDNRPCVNPAHLRLGTHADNMQDMVAKGRGWQQRKTHCPRGHLLAHPNLVLSRLSRGSRKCRACQNAAGRAYRRRQAYAARRREGADGE